MASAIVVVLGSTTRPGRFRAVLEAAVAEAGDATLIDLADVRIGFAGAAPTEETGDETAALITAIAQAPAVVFATPVYRGSMTGSLKNLLDQVPVEALEGTATGIVSMGASDHHFLGADRHLRDVLAYFGAHVGPVSVYLTSADFPDGGPSPAAIAEVAALLRATRELADRNPAGPGSVRPLGARR
jgi:FMN reductase